MMSTQSQQTLLVQKYLLARRAVSWPLQLSLGHLQRCEAARYLRSKRDRLVGLKNREPRGCAKTNGDTLAHLAALGNPLFWGTWNEHRTAGRPRAGCGVPRSWDFLLVSEMTKTPDWSANKPATRVRMDQSLSRQTISRTRSKTQLTAVLLL